MRILPVIIPFRFLKKGRLDFFAGLAILFLASCSSNTDQVAGGSSSTETGDAVSLTGRVVYNNEGPVSGIVVSLARLGVVDTTDSQGRYLIQKKTATVPPKHSTQSILDTLVFKQNGCQVAALIVTKWIDTLPDVQIVQRDISGNLLPGEVKVSKVEAVLSGDGIAPGNPLVAQLFYNVPARNYSGFIYFPWPYSIRNYSIYVNVYDSSGHLTGRSQTVPFNSTAGDITVPAFNPGNAIPAANAGRDTALHVNDLLALHGSAVDSFGGTIAKWEWKIGSGGVFKATSTGDTVIQMPSQPFGNYPCVLRVTDNDGNVSPDDTLMVRAIPVLVTVGTPGTILKNENSVDWMTEASGTTLNLNAVYFVSADMGWVVGGGEGTGGLIRKTTDGGATWFTQMASTSALLYSVQFVNANTGWAAGNSGGVSSICSTKNGGVNWTVKSINGEALNEIYLADTNTGWTVGDSGLILKTTDGFTTWAAQTSGTTQDLNAVHFVNASIGWAAGSGGAILKTTNGGTAWIAQTSGTTKMLYALYFLDASTGWAAGSGGTILKTTNGGAAWIAQNSKITTPLLSIYFADVNLGWVTGNSGVILRTTDGGASWTAQTSGTTSNLHGISPVP
jgi:photosystem II stability/assembly factor-like uncharacterized protein